MLAQPAEQPFPQRPLQVALIRRQERHDKDHVLLRTDKDDVRKAEARRPGVNGL
jgi:hypothetical protein